MLDKLGDFFEFSRGQIITLAVLAFATLAVASYQFIRTYTTPPRVATALPVFLGDADTRLIGYFTLDPNLSPADSLELLPGIGPVLADRIVKYRQSHRFVQEVDITEVSGIGPKLYERLRPYLRIQRP